MNKVSKTDKDPCIIEYSYDVPSNAVRNMKEDYWEGSGKK